MESLFIHTTFTLVEIWYRRLLFFFLLSCSAVYKNNRRARVFLLVYCHHSVPFCSDSTLSTKRTLRSQVAANYSESHNPQMAKTRNSGEPSQEWAAKQNYSKSTVATHPRDQKRCHSIQRTEGLSCLS